MIMLSPFSVGCWQISDLEMELATREMELTEKNIQFELLGTKFENLQLHLEQALPSLSLCYVCYGLV